MATVLTDNSPTLFRCDAIPPTATSAKPSTPAVHKQNATASPTLEERADKLLLKARSPMRVDEVQGIHARINKKQNPPRPDGPEGKKYISDGLWDLMNRCHWLLEPCQRYSMEHVHGFFKLEIEGVRRIDCRKFSLTKILFDMIS